MKRISFIIVFTGLCMTTMAQKKITPQAIVSLGLVAGEDGGAVTYRASVGGAKRNSFAGIGFGVDNYFLRSMPLFLDVRLNLDPKHIWYLYANGGYNFPFDVKRRDNDPFKIKDTYKGGIYSDFGVGGKIYQWQRHEILFDAGFTYKKMENTYAYEYPCLNPPCPQQEHKRNYGLGRVTTKLSWRFGN